MSDIKNALTRKFGPLPAWAWLSIFGVAVWIYRRKMSGASATNTANTTTGQIQSDPGPLQDPVTLQPGESVYNPNTGTLSTAPGGTGGSDPTTTAPSTTTDPGTGTVPDITLPLPAQAAARGTGNKSAPPKLRGRGAIMAKFGHKKPAPKKGYETVGLGRGFWEYKPKPSPTRTTKHKAGMLARLTPASGTNNRAGASTKNQGRSKSTGQNAETTRTRTNNATPKPVRSRPKTPVVAPTSNNQRPAPTHQRPQSHPARASTRPSRMRRK